MTFALALWAYTLVKSVICCIYICHHIERTGVKRWGATGRLFKYE